MFCIVFFSYDIHAVVMIAEILTVFGMLPGIQLMRDGSPAPCLLSRCQSRSRVEGSLDLQQF